jgi:RND family efflux transporter MFP subunit
MMALAAVVVATLAWLLYGRGTPVTAAAAYRGTAVEIVYATGAVEPVRWAKVTSLIRDRIVYICDCEGRQIVKGDVLARLDDREVKAQLEELRAREEFLKREASRVTELVGRGAATTQALERSAMELRQNQALIGVQLERINFRTIVSPIDGVVLRRDGEIGEIADVGQVLFRVGVPKPLRVVAEVNEEDIPRVVLGHPVLFRTDAFPNGELKGSVAEITPLGDPVTKTYRIRIALPDDTPLKPGMSLEANIITREKPGALLVPADALHGDHVFTIDGSAARLRPVKVGIRGTRAIEIIDGLQEGELVLSPAPPTIKDKQRINVTVKPPRP